VANVRFVLGAEADIATSDDVHGGFKDLRSDLVGSLSRQKPIMRPLAKFITLGTGGGLTLGQTAILNLGRPNSGRTWKVTRVTVIGVDDHTAGVNLVAAIYIGDAAQASLTQVVQHGQTIPFTTVENDQAFVVHDREDLFVNFTAVTNDSTTSTAVVTAVAWEYPDAAISAQVI
jgi:hypothetical protein